MIMDNIKLKQSQFIVAIERYKNKSIYKIFDKCIAILNVSLQIILACLIFRFRINWFQHFFLFIIAYFFADFINGLVHMYMDSNDNYDSIAGPLIANFHLHHRTPLYKKNNVIIVYFNESGSKIWLCGFMLIFLILINIFNVNPIVSYGLFYFCVLSSVAEVSHYLCHVSNSKVVDFFMKIYILLNKKHHAKHHIEDNVNYAFLNGMSDILINNVANRFYYGYKNTTDKHYAFYKDNEDSR